MCIRDSLKDVAKCEESTNNLYFYNLFYSSEENQKALVIGMTFTQAPNSNTIEVTNKVKAALAEIEKTLPGTVKAFIPYAAAGPIPVSYTHQMCIRDRLCCPHERRAHTA